MAKITQQISNFPPAPNTQTQTPPEFSATADAWVHHQGDNYTPEVNTWAGQANSLGDDMNTIKDEIDAIAASIPSGTINDTVIGVDKVFSNQKTESIYLKKSGDTMTGQLKGIAPIATEDMVIKGYVDALIPTAWAYFDRSTRVLKASHNVSSVTKSSEGGYDIHFSTPMDNTNYFPLGQVNVSLHLASYNESASTIAMCRVETSKMDYSNGSTVWFDALVGVVIYGGKA